MAIGTLTTKFDEFLRHQEFTGDDRPFEALGHRKVDSLVLTQAKLSDFPRLATPAALEGYSKEEFSSFSGSPKFTGTRDLAHALELATKGDYELLARAKKLNATASGEVEVEGIIRDVIGEYLDIGDYCAGIPECFFSEHITDSKPKAIRIIVDLCASCVVSLEAMLERAEKVTGILVALESAGIDVELVVAEVCFAGDGASRLFVSMIPIKPLGSPVDRAVLAFWSGHPSALRRCKFRVQESNPFFKEDLRYGYGTTLDRNQSADMLTKGIGAFLSRHLPGDIPTVYIPPLSRPDIKVSEVIDNGIRQVQQAGIELRA